MAITIGIDYYFNVRQHLPQNSSTPISESNSIPVASSVPDSILILRPQLLLPKMVFNLKLTATKTTNLNSNIQFIPRPIPLALH